MAELWTEKFFPKNLEEFIGNTDLVQKALLWGREWNKGSSQKPLLFFGQTGSGKTALAYLLARINSWSLFELNASDLRNKEVIESVVSAAAMNSSFSGKKRLILLDEIDGLSSVDRGASAAVNKILKESQNPVILTANNVFGEKKLLAIRTSCNLMQFKKINYLSMAKRLKEICVSESIEFDEEAIQLLAKNSAGDMRSALIDLQVLSSEKKISLDGVSSLGYREKQEDVFKVLRKIFTAETFAEARNARFSADIDSNFLMKWIEENIPRQFSGVKEIQDAFNALSKADIFNGRIRKRQHYGFLRYSSDLMTVGVSLCKESPNRNFVMYQFPKVLSKMSGKISEKEVKKSIAGKLSKDFHSSSKEIFLNDIPFITQLFRNNRDFAVSFSARFDLNEKEIAFLLGTKPETKKVGLLLSESQQKKKSSFLGRKPLSALTESLLGEIEKDEPEKEPEPVVEEKQSSLNNYFS
ncbi:MAG: replication factor C large subunit [archaeon]